MWIYEALRGVELLEGTSSTADVTGVRYDSRKVGRGDVFVAMQGETTDGNRYISDAIARGAAAVISDSRDAWSQRKTVPTYLAANGRRALAGLAANLLGHPERQLAISAVTGTNGKTTTAFLLEQMLRNVARKCVLIGTIEMHVGGEVRSSEHTTPESSDLLRIFADGVKAKATEVVMEMSSHALAQERVWGLHVDVAIFTNLTQDHLDYHGTMEAYYKAKQRLFAGIGCAPPRVAIVNADDPEGGQRLLRDGLSSPVMTYGIANGAYRAEKIVLHAGSTSFDWITPSATLKLESPLTGRVNVYNLLAASCAALARGLSPDQIAAAAKTLKQVPGRFQTVQNQLQIMIVIDYAHTDDALRNLIAMARELVEPHKGRVITLFGCGGDRDRGKRRKMGRAAGEGSFLVVLTSDNSRTEDPEAIIEEALRGVRETTTECIVEIDRAAAIALAIRAASAGDVVLLAGKGHERVQIIGTNTVPFDDVEVATGVLRNM